MGTYNGTYSSVVTLNPASPDVTIGTAGLVNAYGPAGAYTINTGHGATLTPFAGAMFGPSTGLFTITNSGTIETHGTSSSNPFAGGILLGASGTVINKGIISGASGIAIFGSSSSYIYNNNQINGSIGVGVALFSGIGTVVNSGTIHGTTFGAVALFGGGEIINTALGVLSSGLAAGDQYAVSTQKGSSLTTVLNLGSIVGYTGGINLQGGGLVNNIGYIHAAGTNAAGKGQYNTNLYGGVLVNYGGTVLNSGTIIGQNGVYLHYYNATTHNNTPPSSISGYVDNKGLIEANSTGALHLTLTGSTYGLFGAGIGVSVPATVVNTGTINASNAGIVIQTQGTNAGTIKVSNNGLIDGVRYAGVLEQNGVAIIHNAGTIAQTGLGGGTASAYAGILLQQSGQIFNSLTGVITGLSGLQTGSYSYVYNAGRIAGNYNLYGGGVIATNGLRLNNAAQGVITGSAAGVFANIGLINIQNAGTIKTTGTNGFDRAVDLLSTAFVKNQGTIESATGTGVWLNVGGALNNQNLIEGNYAGAKLTGFGTVENSGTVLNLMASTTLSDFTGGVIMTAGGSVVNSGLVESNQFGIFANNVAANIYNTGSIAGNGGTFTVQNTIVGTLSLSSIGVYLGAGGTVTNQSSGLITGRSGIHINNYGVVDNAGAVGANHGTAIEFGAGGKVVNSGTIAGVHDGIVAGVSGSGYAFVSNSGLITAGGTSFVKNGLTLNEAGVSLLQGGNVTNQSGGTISAGVGVYLHGPGRISNQSGGAIKGNAFSGVYAVTALVAGPTLINNGYISAKGRGVYFKGGGTVSNAYGATIAGGADGIYITTSSFAAVTIDNSGKLIGTGTTFVLNTVTYDVCGVDLKGGATLNNAVTGTIAGYAGAVLAQGTETLINAGLIQGGGSGNAVIFGGSGDRMILNSGARFVGSITDQAGNGALELASSSSAGLFDMGGTVSGFTAVTFDNGGQWTLEGNITELGSPTVAISGFTIGDTLVLQGFTATSETFVSGVNALQLSNGSSVDQITLLGPFTSNEFTISAVAGGTEVHICYLRGTRILTPSGERPVEDLAPGDEVVARHAGIARLKWIGRQNYAARFLRRDTALLPVRILPGALGEGLPRRELVVSPGHSVLLGEVLVLARDLVNGVTILQDSAPDLIEYYALELEAHDCVLAEGVFAETYADAPGLRAHFHNAAEFYAAFPHHVEPEALRLCAPRPEGGPSLEAALRPVVTRAASLVNPGSLRGYVEILADDGTVEGWAQDAANPELPVQLDICADGVVVGSVLARGYRGDLRDAGIGKGRAVFCFLAPPGACVSVHRAADGAMLPAASACQMRMAG